MKTKNPIKPNGSDQDRTVSGHIAKSTRTSITIKFPKAYINEYRQGKMVERMSTANHTSQNAMDANYAGQVQENFDQIIKSEKMNITIKLPSAYIEKVRQGIVVEGIPHKDKSQSASKESAYSYDSNALGLDKTVACMAKASTTEIKRHENVSTSPTTRGPSSGFSTCQERLDRSKTPSKVRLIVHKTLRAKRAWARLNNKEDSVVQKPTIVADAFAQKPCEALVKTEAEERHQEKMKKIDAMMIPADPELKARLEEYREEENSYNKVRIGNSDLSRPAAARHMSAWVDRLKKTGQSEEEWENPFEMDGDEFLEYDLETCRRKAYFLPAKYDEK